MRLLADPLPGDLPVWLRELVLAVLSAHPDEIDRFTAPPGIGRRSAVLILFGEGGDGPDLLITRRADRMSSHAGQPAFPGGRIDPDDDGPVGAALREAVEETGVDPRGVVPLISMPELFLPVSDHLITPVVAWWREPSPVGPVDPRETAEVVRMPVQALADPANRFRVRHSSGYTGPAFLVDGFLVWGWTGGVVTYLLRVGGWTRPWDSTDVRELDAVARRAQT